MLINYEDRNQWKIYNFLNKKMHILRDVRFDEKENYYKTDSSFSQCIIEESEKKEEMKHIWTESEDEKMNETQRSFTASKNKYFTSSNTENSADINEKKKFENINER